MTSTSYAALTTSNPGAEPDRVARGIWLPAGCEDPLGRLRVIAEALPPHSVFVGRTAAKVRALWLPSTPGPHRVEIASTAPGRGCDMNRTRRPELVGSRRQLRDDEVTLVDGLPVTTAARTWLDLAGASVSSNSSHSATACCTRASNLRSWRSSWPVRTVVGAWRRHVEPCRCSTRAAVRAARAMPASS